MAPLAGSTGEGVIAQTVYSLRDTQQCVPHPGDGPLNLLVRRVGVQPVVEGRRSGGVDFPANGSND
jgi:hypothetical protein